MRVPVAVLAGAALVWAVTSRSFRDGEGVLGGTFVVPLALAVAFALFALFGRPGRLAFLRWTGLALVGQAVTLQLMRAGPLIGYQHYVEVSQLFSPAARPWTAFLIIQSLIVGVALRRAWPALRERISTRPSGWRIAAVLLVFMATAAALSRSPVVYAGELALAAYLQFLQLATVILAALAAPPDVIAAFARRWDGWRAGDETSFFRTDRFVAIAAGWAVLVTALLCIVVYERHAHVPDEVAYLLHAKYFAHGLLEMPLPPVPAAFDIDLFTYEAGRWYSPVPPGWPAVLAIGSFFGVPWLVNPLLSGVAVWLAYVLVRAVYDTRTAKLTTILLCTSPWFLFLGMSFMSHQLTLAVALAGAVAVARLRMTGAPAWTLPAGVALGVLALLRPLEGFVAALLLGFWTLGGIGPRLRRIALLAAMAVVSIVTASITLPYNRYFTGSATEFPIMAYTEARFGPGSFALGFGPDRGLGWPGLDPFPGHGALDVLVNTNLNLYQLNVELLGWSTGSLLLIAVLAFSRSVRRADRWMLLAILAVIAAHAFFWFSGGPDFGARYWYLILIPCLVLTARGLDVVMNAVANSAERARPAMAALILVAGTLLVFLPWRSVDKYHHYRQMRPDIRRLEAEHAFGRSLVLVRGRRFPDYMSAAVYNPIDLASAAPIYAWDRSDAVRRALLEAYRDRPVWIVDGTTRTNGGFRVVAGPLEAEQLLAESAGVH
jgi:hypothetical protein